MNLKMLKAALVGLVLSVSGFANAGLIPVGIQNDTSVSSILNDGWSYLYRENVGLTSNISDVFGNLSNNDWIIVAGIRNSDDMVLAHAAITWGEFSMYTTQNQTHTFNGADWYYNGNSMGFTAIGDAINQTSADTSSFVNGNQGLSIHTNYISGSHGQSSFNSQSSAVSPTLFGSGYRVGSAYVGNSGTEHDFAFFVMNSDPATVPEPSTLAIFALGVMGLAARRFKKQS
jgi:hypothetical protein